MSEGLLTITEAASLLGVPASTLYRTVRAAGVRPYAVQGRSKLYLARDLAGVVNPKVSDPCENVSR